MKRLFYAVIALSLMVASCAKDEVATPEAKTKTVTFSVETPEMHVRSGEGNNANVLYYAFYDENGLLADLSNIYPPEGEPLAGDTFTAGSKNIKVTLVEGRTYHAIFYAHSNMVDNDIEGGATLYIPDWEAKTVTFNYDYSKVSNPELYDAFYAYLGGITTENLQNDEAILLKRPFAQLNIAPAMNDISAAGNAGVAVQSVAVVATIPTKLDFVTGAVSEKKEVTLGWHAANSQEFMHNEELHTVYALNYILAGKDVADKRLANVKFMMSEKFIAKNETYDDAIIRTFENVPIQRNCRTYILGNIVTASEDGTTYIVQTSPDFDNENNPTIHNE